MSRQRFVCLYIYTAATLFCVSAQFHTFNESDNGVHLLPAYTIASRADLLNSATCGVELRDFQNAVDQRILWGLKILDSSGSPKSGFVYGNNYWLGSRNQCLDTMNKTPFEIAERNVLNNTKYRDPRNEFPPFEVNYFVAHLRHNSTLQYHFINMPEENIITLGLCLPASCSVNNISIILEKICRDRVLVNSNLYSDLSLIQVKDLKDDHQWLLSGAMPLICVVLVLTFFMLISGTIYDIFVHQKYLKTKNKTIISKDAAEMEMIDVPSLRKKKSVMGKILMCFSVYTNTKTIFCTKLNTEAIPVIHGVRFLTMIWIIAVHGIFFTWDYFDNKMWLARLTEGMANQIIDNMPLAVDTYFLLGGLLLSYTYLKDKTNEARNKSINCREKLNEFFVYVIKRFIRLTPPYIMMIGILQLNSTWDDKTSQFYNVIERSHEICPKYWWRNLLYIINFFGYRTMCMPWSWYLANDMQFYIIGLMLLILSTIYFYTAVALLGTLLIGSIILSGYISYIYEYVPTIDDQIKFIDVLYFPPWVRIGPYIIGIITGYIIRRLNKKIVLKRRTVILYWCLASACNILVLFGLYKRQISVLSSAIYVALSRTVWAIGIAWIVIACSTKHGGIVTKLLTSKIWIPLSQLTYCAYLVHPFVVNLFRLHNASIHVEMLSMSAMTIGYLGISYFCAYALSLTAELPYILLYQKFMQSRGKDKS